MNIDLVMISRLGSSDGGRETWLTGFLPELAKQRPDSRITLITLKPELRDPLDGLLVGWQVIRDHTTISCAKSILPVSLCFILKFGLTAVWRKKTATHVLAVGGVGEGLATMLGHIFRSVEGRRILWVRTIYTHEKASRLNIGVHFLVDVLERIMIKWFDIVIANGSDTAKYYDSLGAKCVVINNGVHLERWHACQAESSDRLRVAFIGRLAQVKGIHAFIDAAHQIRATDMGHAFDFIVVGDGPARQQAEAAANANVLDHQGAVPNKDMPEVLARVDVCVALTHCGPTLGGGGVSNALLEQMASGKVIVAWDNEIFRQVLDDESAYFVEEGSVEALGSTITWISQHREEAYGKAVRARDMSRGYAMDVHVSKFLEQIG